MPKKDSTKTEANKNEKTSKCANQNSFVCFLYAFGRGILRFFEIIVKALPEILKSLVWVLWAALFAVLVAVIVVYVALSGLGIKESKVFQDYRDGVIKNALTEYELLVKERAEEMEDGDDEDE